MGCKSLCISGSLPNVTESRPIPRTMRAAIWTRYGGPDVLKLASIPVPKPKADELLIRIHAANIFTGDSEMRQFKVHPSLWILIRLFMGLFKPRIKILGQEFSGTVVARGDAVSRFAVGEDVFGSTGMKFGAYAEYVSLPASYPIIRKPAALPHLTASTIPVGGLHALHFLRLAELKAGEEILMIGGCGCIGTYAVQLAKLWGARVTAIDEGEKLPVLEQLGADRVIDYRKIDFTQEDYSYDVIFDIVGTSPYSASLRRLKPGGRYILANVGLWPMLRAVATRLFSDKRVITKLARVTEADLETFAELILERGIASEIDRTYALEQVDDAHRYIDAGHKKGHVALVYETAAE